MAHNNVYSIEQSVSASGSGRPLLSAIGSNQGMEAHSHGPQSAAYSPKHGHYNAQNGVPSSTHDAKQGLKRKRSIIDAANRHTSEDSYTDGDGPGVSNFQAKSHFNSQSKAGSLQQQQQQADAKKRTKTQRACDKCRTKKIRCDVLPDTEPPLCAHCKQYNYDCTFFLPIQETRFKKKRAEDDSSLQIQQNRPFPVNGSMDRQDSAGTVRTYGPTSIPFMINSTASLPLPQELHSLNPRSVYTVVTTGDGYVKVGSPASPIGYDSPFASRYPEVRIEKDIVEQMINSYFANIAPIFPVITKSEFLAYQPSPPPILTYSICLMAAVIRNTPRGIFDLLRKTVASLIRSEDVLSVSLMANVQALLILSMSGDCHASQSNTMMSLAWNRTGTAIRMAQDLNLHRSEISKEGMETRRRVWATCVVVDRWYSAAFGYPQMIDLTDCDVRLPTPQDQGIGYLNALTRLSIILGEILKAIYSPSGLYSAQDAMLEDILRRLDLWKTHLPEELAFKGSDSTTAAGLLHVFYTCVCMIFWRVFMRISFICPPHIHFCLNVSEWNRVIENSREAIQWIAEHPVYWDSWFVTPYSLVSCALVQYHAWARRKDQDAVASLLLLRDLVKGWEAAATHSEQSGRTKCGEILSLLYEVTQSPQHVGSASLVLGPTVGVRERTSNGVDSLVFRKDPKNGGAYVTSDPRVAEELKELPKGLIITEPSTPASLMEEGGHRPGKTSEGPDGVHQNGLNGPASSSMESVNVPQDQSGSRNGSLPPVNATPYAQHHSATSASPGDAVLEGIPGNMFDWGGWDRWLQTLGSDAYGGLPGPASAVPHFPQ